MNPQATTRSPRPLQLDLAQQHLTHTQLCDLLLHDDLDVHALEGDVRLSTAAADHLDDCQEHVRDCLICSAELQLLRRSVAVFHTSSVALATRELARRPLPGSFSSIYLNRARGHSAPTFIWATAALAVAALLPLTLLHLRPNSLLNHPAATPQTSSSTAATTQPAVDPNTASDAALLDDINQDLSAAVPEPMQPLATPAAESNEPAPGQRSN